MTTPNPQVNIPTPSHPYPSVPTPNHLLNPKSPGTKSPNNKPPGTDSFPKWLENPWVITALIVAALVVLTMLSKLATGVRQPVAPETIQKSDMFLRAANRWAVMAEQDANPIMALRHIGAAKTYIEALRGILNDSQIYKAHNVDMQELAQKMDDIEQGILRKIAEVAPELMPEGEFAARTGWLA